VISYLNFRNECCIHIRSPQPCGLGFIRRYFILPRDAHFMQAWYRSLSVRPSHSSIVSEHRLSTIFHNMLHGNPIILDFSYRTYWRNFDGDILKGKDVYRWSKKNRDLLVISDSIQDNAQSYTVLRLVRMPCLKLTSAINWCSCHPRHIPTPSLQVCPTAPHATPCIQSRDVLLCLQLLVCRPF